MAKDPIRYGKNCSICNGKMKRTDDYVHILSDATLCHKCHSTITQLLDERKWWISADKLAEAGISTEYDFFDGNCMSLSQAQALFELRDSICAETEHKNGTEGCCVFAINQVFQMPKKPSCFILRAMKIKNKTVLQGFPVKGTVKKGDKVTININGVPECFTALDVIPRENNPLSKDIFFDMLNANVHNHTVRENSSGWIIIDTEDYQRITAGCLVSVGENNI